MTYGMTPSRVKWGKNSLSRDNSYTITVNIFSIVP